MNWFPDPEALLQELLEHGVIDQRGAAGIQRQLRAGASVVSALRLGGNDSVIWPYLAQKVGRPYYPDQQSVRVMFTDLLNFIDVLSTGFLPQRTRGNELQVLTYNPVIASGPHERFPGWLVTPALVSPTLWRTLYELGYPRSITGRLNEQQATALVSLTTLGTTTGVTPDQHAEIQALVRGYTFIDPTINPPNPAVRGTISLPSKALNRCYPHHEEAQALVVMMVDPDDTQALRNIQIQTQMRVIPAITTQQHIDKLLTDEEFELQFSAFLGGEAGAG